MDPTAGPGSPERCVARCQRRILDIGCIVQASAKSIRGLTELTVVEGEVEAPTLEQIEVSALLDNMTAVHDDDGIGIANRRESMGNDEAGATSAERRHSFLDENFRPRVDVARCFIEDQDARTREEGPRNGQQLSLTRGDI